MPRTGRVVVPNVPHHVVQRGHNRQFVFDDTNHYIYYLDSLKTFKAKYGVKVYAYCLMGNHVHLILEPPDDVTLLAKLMKRVAGRQTRYFNRVMSRRGTLWEGRYKSSPIQSERYFLECCRYVELNPVRAGLVQRPDDYRWSSYPSTQFDKELGWLDEHTIYLALGDTPEVRRTRYTEFVDLGLVKPEVALIRTALQRGQLTGDEKFVEEVAGIVGHRVESRGPGRR